MCERESIETCSCTVYLLKTNPANSMLDFTVLAISHKLSATLSFSCRLNSGNNSIATPIHAPAPYTNPEFKDER